MFFTFYQLGLRNETCVALAKSTTKHQHHQIETRASLNLVMILRKCTGVDILDEYLDPLNFVDHVLGLGFRVHIS